MIQTIFSKSRILNIFSYLFFFNVATAQITESKINHVYSELYCKPLWEDATFGACMGRNHSLLAVDIDHDGIDELIVNANNAEELNFGFWYVIKYNPINGQYEQIHVSRNLEGRIDKMAISSVIEGTARRLCIAVKESIYIFDLENFEFIKQIVVGPQPNLWQIDDLGFKDLNSDDIEDIVVSGNNWVNIIDGDSYNLVSEDMGNFGQQKYGRFEIGNVDNDPLEEIVFAKGTILEVQPNGDISDDFIFSADHYLIDDILLEDTDNDGKMEAIIGYSSQRIEVMDLETGFVKLKVSIFFGGQTMVLKDIAGDGNKELILTSGSLGVYAVNLVNGNILWNIDPSNNNFTSLAVTDFDSDGEFEMVYSSGCGTSISDQLLITNINSGDVEFQNIYVEGKFNAIEVADLDQDGEDEIIAMTAENGSKGGTLNIFDASSKALKFRSEDNHFPVSFGENQFIEIVDFGDDGDLDIIVVGGSLDDGKIWVVDGTSYDIEYETSITPPWPYSSVWALTSFDIDGDGIKEFFISIGKNIYRLNGLDFSIEWQMELPQFERDVEQILIEDVNGDGEYEIILVTDRILIVNEEGDIVSKSSEYVYTCVAVGIWKDSEQVSILAGTREGEVNLLDENLKVVFRYSLENYVSINGITFSDLNNDGLNELVIGTDENLVFLTQDFRVLSNPMSIQMGKFDGLKAIDYDNDGRDNILVGGINSIMEADLSCLECLFREIEIETQNPTCSNSNGKIIIHPNSQISDLQFNGLPFDGIKEGLTAGKYNIQFTNLDSCKNLLELELFDAEITANVITKASSCFGFSDGEAYIQVLSGKPEYSYSFVDGISIDDTLTELKMGVYVIYIRDANNCEIEKTFEIEEPPKIEFVASLIEDDPDTDQPDGSISISPTSIFDFLWDDGSNRSSLERIENGSYSLTITDGWGCLKDSTFFLGVPITNIDIPDSTSYLYPNPTSNYVNLTLPDGLNLEGVYIFFTDGRLSKYISNFHRIDRGYEIDVSDLETGMYLLYFNSGGSEYYRKLVIN